MRARLAELRPEARRGAGCVRRAAAHRRSHRSGLSRLTRRPCDVRRRGRATPCPHVRRAGKKNAAGWPRKYSQTPSDEGNKQL
ncbi:hypothetical protein DF156_32945 [Burkholderia ubonensis]|uniref:Uncharacterized protein n=1 Tax=Burkholderia ubonensis TaxID=101571 RepID=A0AB74D1X4_9BURK|nr:hypothetical protein CJO71_10870 [Burkholderia ubonensis]PAK01176.1 hypothetical protein CJO68_09955 [Burkholderia ubonensis]RQP27302.1 hypothetical protein DF155_33160 [Burkholderia ubonensis]RQP29116.1 hypothetical protein DF154_33545 [Burkholderia ubonensis]RQP30650.1 hypothetical protein DF156_32945 [Burkholderia ubonensis]